MPIPRYRRLNFKYPVKATYSEAVNMGTLTFCDDQKSKYTHSIEVKNKKGKTLLLLDFDNDELLSIEFWSKDVYPKSLWTELHGESVKIEPETVTSYDCKTGEETVIAWEEYSGCDQDPGDED